MGQTGAELELATAHDVWHIHCVHPCVDTNYRCTRLSGKLCTPVSLSMFVLGNVHLGTEHDNKQGRARFDKKEKFDKHSSDGQGYEGQ